MFLSSTTRPFLRPDLPDSTAPRTEAVKTGRRPPPQAAQCGLDGREHGATLNQVGGARFLSRHTIRKGWLTDLLPAGLTARCFFACHNGRKSHHPTEPIPSSIVNGRYGHFSPLLSPAPSDCLGVELGSRTGTRARSAFGAEPSSRTWPGQLIYHAGQRSGFLRRRVASG